MAGAGFKTFTAGEVLTASNVNTYLQEQTVMNFAGTAARASALPSPSEGMVSHIGGGTVEVYDGAAWVDIAPTPVSDSGLVLIDEESFSAVSSVSLNNVFSATYENYRILATMTASGACDFYFRLRVGGSDNSTASSYIDERLQADGTTVSCFRQTENLATIAGLNSTYRNSFSLDIFRPAVAEVTNYQSQNYYSTNNASIRLYAGVHNQSTAYDGLTFFASGGNTFTGKLKIYGYKGA